MVVKAHSKLKRVADTEATQEAIVAAGVECFGKMGYAAAGLGDIAKCAKVTTGAIYHHFSGKRALFKAVAEAVEEEIVAQLGARAKSGDAWSDLVSAVDEALEVCMAPHIRQIVFLDAPTVIGGAEWRQIQSRYGLGLLAAALRELQEEGIIATRDVELTARVVLAALIEAAEASATAAQPGASVRESKALLRRLLTSLKD
jgi:AcrR family transcriptional regulator